jgi:hypothetical protein
LSFSDCAPASCSLAAKIGLESLRMVSAPMKDLGQRLRRRPSKGITQSIRIFIFIIEIVGYGIIVTYKYDHHLTNKRPQLNGNLLV